MAKEPTPEQELPAKGPSIIVYVIVFLIVTAIAAGAGIGASYLLQHLDKSRNVKADDIAMSSEKEDHKGMPDENGEMAPSGYAKMLSPILTNLAAPSDVWVRMEVAIVTPDLGDEVIAEKIHQDLFAYMRTVKLHHVEGPSGYMNLKAELKERAFIRSQGKVTDVLIRTLVFE